MSAERKIESSENETHCSSTSKENKSLEAAPPGKGSFSRKFMEEFIACYAQYPLLWNPEHPKYRLRSLRGEAYTKLLKIMKDYHGSDCSFDDVRKKIHNIRTVFKREQAKLNDNPNYISTIWWFPLMSFLSTTPKSTNETSSNIVEKETVASAMNFSNVKQVTCERYSNPKEFLREFIKCYGDNSVLWQKDHPQYRCRTIKKAAYIKLKQIYKKYYNKDCSYDDIRQRLHTIRNAYRKASARNLDFANNPKLWWYDLAGFLSGCSRSSGNQCPGGEMSEEKFSKRVQGSQMETVLKGCLNAEKPLEIKCDQEPEAIPIQNRLLCTTKEPVALKNGDVVKQTRQKIKLSKDDKMLLKLYDNQNHEQDTYDKMSKIWTDKIRNMNKLQRQYAAQAINEIVFQGELNRLDYDFVQKLSSHLT